MAKNKLAKFLEVKDLPNVYQNPDSKNPRLEHCGQVVENLKENWSSYHFKNTNPITLELACGRGEYTEALAAAFPLQNFIGVDVKGARLWRGAKNCYGKQLQNAAFLRTRIEQLDLFFAPNEIQEVWITFPDPFLREGKKNRRLTSFRFLDIYQKIISPGAKIHLKTDDPTLYDFTTETIQQYPKGHIDYFNEDIYAQTIEHEALLYKTYYEKSHLAAGRKIKYIRFTIN